MTCYFRHLKDVFAEAGIEVTSENKREVDKVIHSMVGVKYKNCPLAWKQVKKRIARDKAGFVSQLKELWNKKI
jgi:hypothetical protein